MAEQAPKTEDEKRFNDTLQRMLKTPPKSHKGDSDDRAKQDAKNDAKETKTL
ncbi:hypothetical protein [Mesorhizobium sp.]|uniref:hypothetical protein n=1 Tax=Mesorhizobium sp. TaxID=1871066 RepID=UPI0025B9D3DF|nr:hypothetical protein [Mesorhizobium sp.]